jgi:peptidoglycan-associated lipoprotein
MKPMKLTSLLVLALALTFAAAGCKHKPVGVTPLPGLQAARVGNGNEGPRPLPPGEPMKPDEGVKTGGGPMDESWRPEDMNQDRAALAAQTVHFDYDSAVVKSGEKPKVEAVAAALKSDAPAKLLIEGHCDERGTEEYNRALGERRALVLREALAKLGVDPNHIRTISYGKDRPVDPGHAEAAWSKNRRGEFVLLHPKQ